MLPVYPPAPRRVQLPDGTELHVLEAGSGPPVVLLHGGMGDAHAWASQLGVLAPGFHAIAYSRRHSSPNRNPPAGPGYSAAVDANDLEALLQLLHTGPAHLVGTSYGALVALVFALRRPEQVLSLVLAEPPLHRWACRTPGGAALYQTFMEAVWHPAARAFAEDNEREALRRLTDGIWGTPTFDALAPPRMAAVLRNATSMQALTQSADPFPDLSREAVARTVVPTLLVRGEHASALHNCVMDELARVLPDARRAVIAGAGHGSPAENPDGFNHVLLAFLAEQRRA